MRMKFKLLLLLSSIAAFFLAGCVSNQPKTKPSAMPLVNNANNLLQEENYYAAAQAFRQLAQQHSGQLKTQYQLKAADALVQSDSYDQARLLISQIDTRGSKPLSFHKHILLAEMAMGQEQYPTALKLIAQPAPANVSESLILRFFKIRADAYRLSGNLLRGARELSALDLLLVNSEERLRNQVTLLRSLSVIDTATLTQTKVTPRGNFAGWIAMAHLVQQYGINPNTLQPHLITWRQQFPSHPALPNLFDDFNQNRQLVELQDLGKVAVLLPTQGRLAQAANMLRDGMLAAYYNQQEQQQAELVFYDTSRADVISLYQRAISEGANIVVGPLQKSSVIELAKLPHLPVPVVTLNLLPANIQAPSGMFQFGLSPEDEAKQVAERAWLDGFTRALILAPEGIWGERLSHAFEQHLNQLGGTVVGKQTYNAQQQDFGEPIKQVLMLDESIQRKKTMQSLMGKKLHFEPRIRQDSDFIFMAAKTRQARQIRPQLQFNYAGDLPVYATSHSFSGQVNPQLDVDLEGIRFVDLPWLLVANTQPTEQQTPSHYANPSSLGSYRRIYALGIDAYNVLGRLDNLQSHQGATELGKTGMLYLDEDNKINRMMVWAKINQGRPELLGYSPSYLLTPSAFVRQQDTPIGANISAQTEP